MIQTAPSRTEPPPHPNCHPDWTVQIIVWVIIPHTSLGELSHVQKPSLQAFPHQYHPDWTVQIIVWNKFPFTQDPTSVEDYPEPQRDWRTTTPCPIEPGRLSNALLRTRAPKRDWTTTTPGPREPGQLPHALLHHVCVRPRETVQQPRPAQESLGNFVRLRA